MSFFDPIKLVFGLLMVVFLFIVFSKRIASQSTIANKLVNIGLGFKMLSVVAFCLVYLFYFKSGDTFAYFDDASQLIELIYQNPIDGISLLFSNPGEHQLSTIKISSGMRFFNADSEWLFVRFSAIIGLFTFGNFFSMSLVFGFISFLGSYYLYRFFIELYPDYEIQFFITTFLIPSCLFWTTGMLKDTVCLTALSLILFSYKRVVENHQVIKYGSIMLVSFYLLIVIKGYIAYSLIPGLLIWGYIKIQRMINSQIIRKSLGLITLSLILLIGVKLPDLVEELNDQLVFNESVTVIKNYHEEYTRELYEGSSQYNLGAVEYNAKGIIDASPNGLVTTMLRPFPWEANKPLMLLMSLENISLLIVVIWLISHPVFFNKFFSLFKNEELILITTFVIILSIIVGVTSYNFGLLMRLKTPILPMLSSGLVILFHRIKTHTKFQVRLV